MGLEYIRASYVRVLILLGFQSNFIEGYSRVIIDCYNKKSNLPSSIILLMEDIWRLSLNLNINKCSHICREANRTIDCLAKKVICNVDSNIWWSNFPRMF